LKWGTLSNPGVQHRLEDAFGSAGVSADRLIFRGKSSHAEMLAEYADVDIALDPFPFSGGLTSCEALWMDVPVVTLQGAGGQSRQTSGFLKCLGLDDYIAEHREDFVAIAASLAGDRERLAALRRNLRARMAASALCDGNAFTRGLESVFREMWQGAANRA
jgi:predicted O-linked N-acetylglucosamine transferase (SPINDLY family)